MDPMQQRVACRRCGAHRDAATDRGACRVCGHLEFTPVPPAPGDAVLIVWQPAPPLLVRKDTDA
jgi:hypothetical protein